MQVTGFIDEYMREPDASLSMVEVSRRLRVALGPADCASRPLLAGHDPLLTTCAGWCG